MNQTKPILDEWIEEEIPVLKAKPVVNERTGKVKIDYAYEMQKQRTMYVDPKPQKMVCAKGQHYFYCADSHRYLFKCRHCNRVQKVYPISHTLVNGQLIDKNGNPI